jgi:hypothetical protein
VDIRVKTFAAEAAKKLDFLKDEYGFAGPDVQRGNGPGTVVSILYRRANVTIEASLVLWYMGEEYVATTFCADSASGTVERTGIARNTAHTGYQMRRALELQAEAVRATIRAA